MSSIKTPGVYIREVSKFPPSVAAVETAIPAFVGYTQKADNNRGKDLSNEAVLVESFVEFEAFFGGPPEVFVDEVVLDVDNNVRSVKLKSTFLLYDSVRLFYENGGKKCYIVSIGKYGEFSPGLFTPNLNNMKAGLAKLEKVDEPTLLLFPDAIQFKGDNLYKLQIDALKQCNKLKDRFVVMDLLRELEEDTSVSTLDFKEAASHFRNGIGVSYLNYGAAYTPYLRVNFEKNITFRILQGKLKNATGSTVNLANLTDDANVQAAITNVINAIADANKYFYNSHSVSNRGYFKGFLKDRVEDSPVSVAPELATLMAGYLYYSNQFKAAVATFRATTGTPPLTPVRTAFVAVLTYVYRVAYALVNIPYINSGTPPPLSVSPDPTQVQYLRDFIRNVVEQNLVYVVKELNRVTKVGIANSRVGGTSTSSIEEVYALNAIAGGLNSSHMGHYALE